MGGTRKIKAAGSNPDDPDAKRPAKPEEVEGPGKEDASELDDEEEQDEEDEEMKDDETVKEPNEEAATLESLMKILKVMQLDIKEVKKDNKESS